MLSTVKISIEDIKNWLEEATNNVISSGSNFGDPFYHISVDRHDHIVLTCHHHARLSSLINIIADVIIKINKIKDAFQSDMYHFEIDITLTAMELPYTIHLNGDVRMPEMNCNTVRSFISFLCAQKRIQILQNLKNLEYEINSRFGVDYIDVDDNPLEPYYKEFDQMTNELRERVDKDIAERCCDKDEPSMDNIANFFKAHREDN